MNGDIIEQISDGLDTNQYARLSDWRGTTPDEMKILITHIIVFGLPNISIEQYWTSDIVLNTPFLAGTWQEIDFKTFLNLHVSDPKERSSMGK